MTKLVVEVVKSEAEADARVERYKQLGCIAGKESHAMVSWLNGTVAAASDTAADPLADEVWVVMARK